MRRTFAHKESRTKVETKTVSLWSACALTLVCTDNKKPPTVLAGGFLLQAFTSLREWLPS